MTKYSPLDYRKTLHSLNITNTTVCDLIYYGGLSVDEFFTKVCNLSDTELFYVLQNFIVKFYQLVTYLIAKQIKISNINEEYFKSWYINEEFIMFMKFMIDHGYYDLSIKRLDFISDINRFFKIKNIDCINVSKVRGRDDILSLIISKMFRVVFYKVLFDLNIRNKLEEANLMNDTYEIIDELYDYFYRKVFVPISGDQEGEVIVEEPEDEAELFHSDEWEE